MKKETRMEITSMTGKKSFRKARHGGMAARMVLAVIAGIGLFICAGLAQAIDIPPAACKPWRYEL